MKMELSWGAKAHGHASPPLLNGPRELLPVVLPTIVRLAHVLFAINSGHILDFSFSWGAKAHGHASPPLLNRLREVSSICPPDNPEAVSCSMCMK